MSTFHIDSFEFSKPVTNATGKRLSDDVMGTNWPVVYLIHGNGELYIGETSDADGRMNQHLDPQGIYFEKRKKLKTVEIIFDTTFNKSAILDVEQSLIRLFKYEIYNKSEKKKSKYFKLLQNGNSGQSRQHNYYRRANYQQEIEIIWDELVKRKIATNRYQDIVNDAIFKFSPYSTLTSEQSETCLDILENTIDALFAKKEGRNADFTAIIQGAAGTGKTIVLLHMMSKIVEAMHSNVGDIDSGNDTDIDDEDYAISLAALNRYSRITKRIKEYYDKYGKIRIAYVSQMTSLRKTIARTLKGIEHMYCKDAIGPNDAVKITNAGTDAFEPFDILFIDEAHRLWQRKSIPTMGSFDAACRKLYGQDIDPNTKTTLDWLFDCSKTRVLIYDELQTVKDSDITSEQFSRTVRSRVPDTIRRYTLKQQMRCAGGMNYLSYLSDIFDCNKNLLRRYIEDYDLQLMDNPVSVIDNIVLRNEQVGLCRTATGYGWQWDRKEYDRCNRNFRRDAANGVVADTRASKVQYYLNHLNEEDGLLNFNGIQYVRNIDYEWIIEGDPREIGCIHTSQGYDLNYVGVLFGPEIDYNDTDGIVIYEDQIKDSSVSVNLNGLTDEERAAKKERIKNYIVNAYKVMMERGIKGCYVWAYNPGLQGYLSRFL